MIGLVLAACSSMNLAAAMVSPALAQAREFDDAEAQLKVRQAANAAIEAAHKVEGLRKAVEAERQRVVQTTNERDLNQAALKSLEGELQAAEARQRELDAALKVAQEARAKGLAESQQRKIEEERRPSASQPPPGNGAEREEAALRLDIPARQRLQVALTSLGLDTRGNDGVFGPRSRDVIAIWQRSHGLPDTGFLTASQVQALQREAAAALSKYDEEIKRKSEEQRKAPEDRARAVAILDFDGDRLSSEIVSAIRTDLGSSSRLKLLRPGSFTQWKVDLFVAPAF
ncbi:MAG TPA: peptidoglycan-binding protein, partial [Reyranella sp.]|nr:peptidoglycan-binding protein [Reyranella sp.]